MKQADGHTYWNYENADYIHPMTDTRAQCTAAQKYLN